MKKIILLVVLILFSVSVSAWEWSATRSFDCDGCCVEDKTFQYSVTITNTGSERFYVDQVKLEKDNYFDLATLDTGYNIYPGNSRSFTLTGNNPSPSYGNTLKYRVCFELSEESAYW